MIGNKIIYPLLFITLTACLIKSRVLLTASDSILNFVDRACRASSIQCTGGDHGLALMITLLIVNGIVALILIAAINRIIRAMRINFN
ncbi:hypothetical protein [Enterobacter sp. DE0047]|uniref:hypothetical protein n=1 Tax=Enterobacter sp. DE0047 TaxID=2584949 RepID=UPI00119DEA30|nr:hypothetical protein [Enterobacter sp. DE0047]